MEEFRGSNPLSFTKRSKFEPTTHSTPSEPRLRRRCCCTTLSVRLVDLLS